MKFTLVFPSSESTDLSIGLVFAPCILWVIGSKILLNPHRENPHYLPGDFQTLLLFLKEGNYLIDESTERQRKKIFLIVHDIGHGIQSYLDDLIRDISESQFEPVLVV